MDQENGGSVRCMFICLDAPSGEAGPLWESQMRITTLEPQGQTPTQESRQEVNEVSAPKKRIIKPGHRRIMVSITEENAATLEMMASDESPVYPRPLNEYLSILIDRHFEQITTQSGE